MTPIEKKIHDALPHDAKVVSIKRSEEGKVGKKAGKLAIIYETPRGIFRTYMTDFVGGHMFKKEK